MGHFNGGFSTLRNGFQTLDEFIETLKDEPIYKTCKRDLVGRIEDWNGSFMEFMEDYRDFRFDSGEGREGGPGYEFWWRDIPIGEWVELEHSPDSDECEPGYGDSSSDGDDVGEMSPEDILEFETHKQQIRRFDLGDIPSYDGYPDIDCDGLTDEGDDGDVEFEEDIEFLTPREYGVTFW